MSSKLEWSARGVAACEARRLPARRCMIRARPVTEGDLPDLLPMIGEYWVFERIRGFDPARIGEQVARLLSDSRLGGAWIGLVDDRPAGYLLAVYVFSLEHLGLTAEIDELFVLPEHRGRGLGAELLRAAESVFVRAGCTNVSLQLAHGNESAREFYRRHGYTERSGYSLLEKRSGR